MDVVNLAELSENDFAEIKNELSNHKTLGQVLTWASSKPKGECLPYIVAETIPQDEYTHDVIIPFRDYFLVFDTT
jgi:hypothetical protein